ncbi:hypothetical protein BJ912DRAFT_1131316 [Pholiota molesta]|nr:hypothetical protein BJ912DRAFT_1131316 [Pholiota molesta]
MWALALGNAVGRKGTGTQGRPESGRPSRCARRAAHLAHPLTHIHLPTVSARGDEGRGHRPRPPFFMPLHDHSHRTPRRPPDPLRAATTSRRGGMHEPSHPSAAARLPPTIVSLPCRFSSPPDARRAHAHASEARPASDGPRTYNGRSSPADGGAGCCCITACGGAGLAQELHGETQRAMRREGRHRSVSPLHPLLQGMGRQACVKYGHCLPWRIGTAVVGGRREAGTKQAPSGRRVARVKASAPKELVRSETRALSHFTMRA